MSPMLFGIINRVKEVKEKMIGLHVVGVTVLVSTAVSKVMKSNPEMVRWESTMYVLVRRTHTYYVEVSSSTE